jgi:hypothetical protein
MYFLLLTLQYGSDQRKEGEMGGACCMHVKCDKHIQNLGTENKTKEHFGRFGVQRKECQYTAQ